MATSTAQGMTDKRLAEHARYVALHGGIQGSCYGCATPYMKALMDRVYEARFRPAGAYAVTMAKCLMHRESQGNPGAISRTGDYGGPQFNYLAHHSSHPEWFSPRFGFRYAVFDPWYGALQMWSLSHGGTSWSPWMTLSGC